MKILHFAADKNGIFQIDPVDYPDREIMWVDDFLYCLDLLDSGELIFTDLIFTVATSRSKYLDAIKKHMMGV
jgi:hypothetical protein